MSREIERIHGSSFGTSGAIQGMQTLAKKRTPTPCDTLVVSLSTLVRNADSTLREGGKDTPIKEIADLVYTDLMILAASFSEYTATLGNVDDPTMVLYIPSYHTFPKHHLRKENNTNARIRRYTKEVGESICKTDEPETLTVEGVRLHMIRAGKKRFPHYEVKSYIDKINSGNIRQRYRQYWLMSHTPIDYHFMGLVNNNCQLLNSYTGELQAPSEMGKKIFKQDNIPFTSATHLMLGDPILIRREVNRADFKRMIEDSKKERWNIKTKQQILRFCERYLPRTFFTTVRMD